MKNIYRILALLLGFGIIISSFIIFGHDIETKIKVLDIIVVCVLYSSVAELLFFPMINLTEKSNKEAAMMGVHYNTLYTCICLSSVIILLGIVCDLSFTVQLIAQLVVLFIFFIGRAATLHSGEHAQKIYEKEQVVISGKMSMRKAMDSAMEEIVTSNNLNPNIVKRLEELSESLRFITPSGNAEAVELENEFSEMVHKVQVLCRDSVANSEVLIEDISKLERIVAKRKKY